MTTTESAPLRFDEPTGRWVLVGTVAGSSMAMLDGTAVNVALPRIGADLDASFGGLQWIVNGYTLSLAALILLGGSLGDRLGRRKMYTVGAAWFTLASIACAAAPTTEILIAARVLQGAGGALLTPASLAILQASFHPDDRARAIGAWSGLGGVATALGPFLGGWLADSASWRWIFLLNVPLGALVLTIARTHIPESRDPSVHGHLDWPGATLGALGLAGLTLGLSGSGSVLTIAGVALLALFVAVEMRAHDPIVPPAIFRSRTFTGTNAVTFFLYGALSSVLFLLGLVLQGPLGYTPLLAGAATMPLTAVMLVLSSRAGQLAERIGPRIPMTVGPVVMSIGLLLMQRIEPGARYVSSTLPAIVVFALGLATTVAPLTATALGSAETRYAGVASGINNAVARTGSLIAVAAIPVLAGFVPDAEVPAGELVDGFHQLALIGAFVVAGAGLLAWLTVGGRRPAAGEAPACFHCAASGPPPAVHVPVGAASDTF
jgi:EmrB/QacA subfamily drug resistance transporter